MYYYIQLDKVVLGGGVEEAFNTFASQRLVFEEKN